jgi:hypothetical protein
MQAFFILVEIITYLSAIYFLFYKKELAIIYTPLIFFLYKLVVPIFSHSIFYGLISAMFAISIVQNLSFFRRNWFSLLLLIYYIFLLIGSGDLVAKRPYIFPVFWFFLSIPLISEVYKKYTKDVILKELSLSATLILIAFVINVVFSTVFRYSPNAMYGIKSGIMYGEIYAAGFNILSIAVFIVLLSFLKTQNKNQLIISIISICFLSVSLRRSVMGVCLFGVISIFLILFRKKNMLRFFTYLVLTILICFVVLTTTNLGDTFQERFESRNLEDRALEEEGRFMEYEFLYNDMFLYENYDRWTGYDIFNSEGNYGRGSITPDKLQMFETRSLHGDLPNIAHSSGIIGLTLYLLMVITAFWRIGKKVRKKEDVYIFLFCCFAFITYTLTGRYTAFGSVILLFLLLNLPSAIEEEPEQ